MIDRNEVNANSKGGTELSMGELESRLDTNVLTKFQVIPSRFRGLKDGLIPIYWVHDTEDDPEMNHLADGGWKKFERIVFVSNWQMQRFIQKFNIPWSKCVVLPNAVDPFPKPEALDWSGQIRFVYHTTPHRGLNVLVGAFDALSKVYPNVHLDVFSSFSIYGWEQRDEPYKPLFKFIDEHPNMTFHGAVPNSVVREALTKTHCFAYPCTWPETGCRALMEAMSAGLVCIHSNYGCLYETGFGLSKTYQYMEDPLDHANLFTRHLLTFMDTIKEMSGDTMNHLRKKIASDAGTRFSWESRGEQWNNFLKEILHDKHITV